MEAWGRPRWELEEDADTGPARLAEQAEDQVTAGTGDHGQFEGSQSAVLPRVHARK